MRVQYISIKKWRHFRDIEIELPDKLPMICLVGSNGTGKSQILELVAACAARIGLANQIVGPRGDPFAEKSEFEIRFFIAPDTCPSVDLASSFKDNYEAER